VEEKEKKKEKKVEMTPISSLLRKENPFLSDKHLPAGSTVTTGRKTSKSISEI
jgi:hypothetical protein